MQIPPLVTRAAALVGFLAAAAVAQCPSLVSTTIAPACSSSGAPLPLMQETVLAASPSACKLQVQVFAPPSCCAFVVARLLALGVDPASVALPGGCLMRLTPLSLTPIPGPTSVPSLSTLELALPATPTTIGLSLRAEAALVRYDITVMQTLVDTTETHRLSFGP